MQLKKNIFLCIYKMYLISTEGYKNVKAIKTTSETSVIWKILEAVTKINYQSMLRIKIRWKLIAWSAEKILKVLTEKWLQQKIID